MGVAVVCTLAASEPASGSVRAKAPSLSAVDQVGQPAPLLLLGAEQQQGADADGVVGVDEDGDAGVVAAEHSMTLQVGQLREAAAAELGRRGHAQHAEVGQAGDHLRRDVGQSRSMAAASTFSSR